MGAKGSLPYSQQPITGTYPEPDESNPHPTTPLCEDQFQYCSRIPYARVFREISHPQAFPTKILYDFSTAQKSASAYSSVLRDNEI
jgi:hypothetical protein